MAAGAFVEPRLIKKTLILVVLFAVGLFTVAALLAARHRFKQVRFYVFTWLGATGSASLMALRHWAGIDVSQEFQYDSMRVVMIFDAVMLGLAIVDRFHQLREERQQALRASLEQAERNLDMNTRLRNLEARYELALETAGKHKQHIENTVHDIRQPLHALRLAVQGIMNDRKPSSEKSYSDVYESFGYLEALVSGHLDELDAAPAEESVKDMRLGEILRSVHEMFLPDAEAKRLAFTYVPTSLATPIQPLALMRIFSNLVANAIKYTPSGRLLLGVRHLGNAIRVELHDTGLGLTAEEFELACKRGSRLDPALTVGDGEGYGLAIVVELARRHGYGLELLKRDTPGTSIGLTIPLTACG
jgi:signal transduction histidine kinase